MEAILCLATKSTEETIHVCGKPVHHYGKHYDPIDKVSWSDEAELPQDVSERKEDLAA